MELIKRQPCIGLGGLRSYHTDVNLPTPLQESSGKRGTFPCSSEKPHTILAFSALVHQDGSTRRDGT